MYLSLLSAIRFYYGFNNTLYYILCTHMLLQFPLPFFFFLKNSVLIKTMLSVGLGRCAFLLPSSDW